MTTSAPSQPAAPATATPSDPERFRVVVPPEVAALLHEGPDVGDPDALEPARIPDAVAPSPPPPPTPAVAPPVVAAPAPAAAPVVSAEPVDPRIKRAEEVWGRVEESVRQARGQRPVGAAPSTAFSDKEWADFIAGAKEEIAKADDFGGAAEEIFKRLRTYDKLRAERENAARWNQKIEILQETARGRYPDFDQMISDAGLWGEAIPDQNGTIRDLGLAKQIYSDPNPPDAAYWVAVGKVAQKQGKSVREFLAERGRSAPVPAVAPGASAPSPVVTPPDTPAPPVAAHPGEPRREPTAAEVARRATAETLDQMASHSARPRGLRSLEPAAPPQNLWSFAELDRLMDRNPDGFLALVETNPGLDQWFMNGGKAVA